MGPETIRLRIEPMVKGLVQDDWQEIALRELTARTFVLNFQGARAAMDAELATSFMGTARQILWALYGDYGLKPEQIDMGCDGVCAGEFAHVRLSAYESKDSYSDVIVHRGCAFAALPEAQKLPIAYATSCRGCHVMEDCRYGQGSDYRQTA